MDSVNQHPMNCQDPMNSSLGGSQGAIPPVQFSEKDLPNALHRLCEAFKELAGIRVELEDRGIAKYPERQMQVFLCRMVQDTLLTLRGDAGASLARMILSSDDIYLKIELEDDGACLDVSETYRRPCTPAAVEGKGGREGKLCEIRESIRKSGGFFHVSSSDKNHIMIVMPV